ncbi:FISUMP domain-containing protein [Elizabethkingia miricola]|uniref:FISUMP domain-containing protein n=1 Tax=Elizabethkingia miricola TaxID=172045 RepID=UPI0038917D9E
MKLYIQKITAFTAVSSLLWTTSCRSSDTENSLATGGPVTISAVLDGVEFGGQTGNPQASTGKINIAENNRQSHTTMLDASSFITVEATTDNSSPQAFAKLNTMAAIAPVIPDTDINKLALPIGTRVRIAAYLGTSTVTDQTKDYIVRANGVLEPENGALTLTHNQPYTLVVYSNGTPTLPSHSSSIAYTYDTNYTDLQKDFMYRKYINYVPNGGLGTNNIVIRLQHKTTQIVTNFNFADNIISINNAAIGTNYLDGTINLNNNSINTEGYVANGTKTGPVPLTIATQTAHTATATPVKINGASGAAGATTTGSFTAQINSTDFNNAPVNRNINAPFLIKPGYKTTLNIVQGRCGANINGVNRYFMCHNLGADYSQNPTSPTNDALVHGAKYVWGAQTASVTQTADQSSVNLSFTYNGDSSSNAWTGTNLKNPCPSGYRVPTQSELESLIKNLFTPNPLTGIATGTYNGSSIRGTWTPSPTNYGSFRTFTSNTDTSYSISLPAAGYRDSSQINFRGNKGYYWTTDGNGSGSYYYLQFDNSLYEGATISTSFLGGGAGAMSVRCIAN